MEETQVVLVPCVLQLTAATLHSLVHHQTKMAVHKYVHVPPLQPLQEPPLYVAATSDMARLANHSAWNIRHP